MTPPTQPDTFPGKGLGIAGLVLAILAPIIGLILSFIANNQSKQAGYANGPAKAGIIIGIILTALGIIISIAAWGSFAALMANYG